MSRTDNDRPNWVKANDATILGDPDHTHVDSRGRLHRRTFYDAPARELIRVAYYGPERAASRDTLVRMAREFNTFGDVDDSPVQPNQHKHAPYRGGYWD